MTGAWMQRIAPEVARVCQWIVKTTRENKKDST